MKFCVIGLGRFGYRVATTLSDHGMEVLGIDSSESIVASIRDQITQAICLRVNDETALRSIGVEEMDTVIVAMGENFAQSILVTALLKKRLNIPTVITRAVSEIHKEILKLIGADQVILPEQEVGVRLADSLSYPYAQIIRLTPNFGIAQIKAPVKFIGKTVVSLKLFERYQVRCIGVKKGEEIVTVGSDYVVNEADTLTFAGTMDKLISITKLGA
jgi:trk system potassium uptake protein